MKQTLVDWPGTYANRVHAAFAAWHSDRAAAKIFENKNRHKFGLRACRRTLQKVRHNLKLRVTNEFQRFLGL